LKKQVGSRPIARCRPRAARRQRPLSGRPSYLAFVSTQVPRPNATAEVVQGGHPPKGALPALDENFGAPFAVKLGPFLSPLRLLCQAPPWC
jgi:glucose dehydrogenase